MSRRKTPLIKMNVQIYEDANCPETLLPTYGGKPRRVDGNRAARTYPLLVLPDCLDPWKMTMPMKPPVLYYGYPLLEPKMMEIIGPLENGPRREGEVPNIGFYYFKAHTILQGELGWKFPLEPVYGGNCMPALIVFWTNYTSPKTRAALEKRIEQVKELLGLTDEPKWHLAIDNRWHWA